MQIIFTGHYKNGFSLYAVIYALLNLYLLCTLMSFVLTVIFFWLSEVLLSLPTTLVEIPYLVRFFIIQCNIIEFLNSSIVSSNIIHLSLFILRIFLPLLN